MDHADHGTLTKPGASAPPIHRGSMVPRPWGRPEPADAADAAPDEPWARVARRRRRALGLCVLLATALATTLLLQAQPQPALPTALRWLHVGLFALLFAWVSAGSVTAAMGFWVLLRGDRHALSARDTGLRPLSGAARTALVMPICNENIATVFAGLRATCESLAAVGALRLFDVYILSDSSDPALRTAELAAWAELRDLLAGQGKVHYRWRARRTKKKAGNVADFCRRWGRDYRYMVVLDADSVMSGDCLLGLVRLMEAHPRAGILQAAPQACGHASLHARAQQFAGRVTGRLFSAGMQYWQLGEAHYWGHNAIIRIEPFMRHCALAPLHGEEILSHDFVEAALMRRAGYQVWLVDGLGGSYEQQPPHLLAELQRDRRWCQGNLQNARLLGEPGLHGVHRGMLLTGAMAYLSAPLWLLYVSLGALLWIWGGNAAFVPPGGFAPGVLGLWAGTVAMLALPRVMGVLAVLLRGEQRQFGGAAALLLSTLLEALMAMLQAPLRMAAHTAFIVGALTGWKLDWKSPPRETSDVGWRQAARGFGWIGVLALALCAVLLALRPSALAWAAPLAVPLLLAVPITVLSSRVRLGARLRAARLLLIPEEAQPPTVLRQAWSYAGQPRPQPGFAELLRNGRLFELVRQAMGPRATGHGRRAAARQQRLRQLQAERRGWEGLSAAERMRFLSEPASLQLLRRAVKA
ncbi:glucans biosynthesis glucosyltransferase MdoH [Roseateles violae]|uniref:Glucans biosynthesis glucosyltransferase H n=1 Tax=Roseateles violae TaxID=3058042 RepID=A0ABT8DJV0_9BURK|nr:glucans biosynthesis glucosyltransferase MdoH [Pelomonas sp. PFR6]MDN3918657.1 glucans biosynthesis glucosyltransferase MdoH [Pelomonas sp. PFR6]